MADDSKATDVGARYAQALFDLAKDEGRIAPVEQDLKSLKAMLADSSDLRTLLASPKFGAEAKGKGLAAVAAKAKLNPTTIKFLGVLSANGRFVTPHRAIVGVVAWCLRHGCEVAGLSKGQIFSASMEIVSSRSLNAILNTTVRCNIKVAGQDFFLRIFSLKLNG